MVNESGISRWQGVTAVLALSILGFSDAAAERRSERPNEAPSITGSPPTTATVGQFYVFQPQASDPDGDRLTFWIRNQPRWARFDSRSGELRGTPTQPGNHAAIEIGVGDWHTKEVALEPFAISVEEPAERVNEPPVIGGAPGTLVVAGETYAFQPVASDPEGARLSFEVQNRPAWASFDASSGRLAGTPSEAEVGTYDSIIVSVTDGATFSSLAPFSIQVTAAPNAAPAISGSPPPSAVAGQPYAFTPAASDPDGDRLIFNATGKPAWASFDAATGRMSGTPGSADVGTTSNVVITVSDGEASDDLPFSVEVDAAPNRAPVLSGTPPTTAMAGEPYAFTPTASDPDGDRLTFAISGKPTWASFDPLTGGLSGTPGTADLGLNYNVVISASDGEATTSLPSFNLHVDQAAVGSVTLSWQAPTHNEDGSPLTDLTGYEVHYGQVAGQYSQTLQLPSAALTSVTIEDLAPATWHFAVKAVNSAGTQSGFSNEAWKTID